MSNSRPRELVLFGLLLASAGLASVTGCANSRDAERREVAELGALHEVHHAEFLAGQEEFRARYPMPQRREVFGVGTLVVHEAALGGRLGQETLHVLFTWVNSTPFKTNGAKTCSNIRGRPYNALPVARSSHGRGIAQPQPVSLVGLAAMLVRERAPSAQR